MSYPPEDCVNDCIDPRLVSVSYSNFDQASEIIQRLGKGTLMGKMDIKSVICLLRCFPGDVDLLGFQFEHQFL